MRTHFKIENARKIIILRAFSLLLETYLWNMGIIFLNRSIAVDFKR